MDQAALSIAKKPYCCMALAVGVFLLVSPGRAALADTKSEDTVRTFFAEGEEHRVELSESSEDLQGFLRRHFSVVEFAWRTAPRDAWDAAGNEARRHYIDVVFCRLANTRFAGNEDVTKWRILGSRDSDHISIVGVLVTYDDGRERRVLFDIHRPRQRIIDVRSEGGRLSQRLAQDFQHEAGRVELGTDAASWLERIICPVVKD